MAALRDPSPPDQGGTPVRLLVRLLATAVALAVAAGLVDGISVGPGTDRARVLTLLGVAIIFGLVNAIVRPILRLLTLPLVVLTLGLFLLVLNALMLLLTEWIAEGSGEFVWVIAHDGSRTFEEADAAYYASPERAALDPNPARHLVEVRTDFVREVT